MQSRWRLGVGEHKSYLRRRTVNFSITWRHPLLIFQLGIQVAHLAREDHSLSSLEAVKADISVSPPSSLPPGYLPIGPVSGALSCWCAPPCFGDTQHIYCNELELELEFAKALVFHLTKWKWLLPVCSALELGLELRTWPLYWLIKSPCAEKDAKIIRSPLRRFHPAVRAFIIPCWNWLETVEQVFDIDLCSSKKNLFAHTTLQEVFHSCQPSFLFEVKVFNTAANN